MKIILLLLSVFTAIIAQNATSLSDPVTKIYVCPKHFIKIGIRCYFFSRNSATWQDAFFQCRDRKSNIAIIKTPNQDRRIRRILHRPTHAIQERWLGGIYNWKQMRWVWAASAKPLTYEGFASPNFQEAQKWNCIIMDPALNYQWNTRPCIEKKPYICHTRSKVVTQNANFLGDDAESTLNEIQDPDARYHKNPASLKAYTDENGEVIFQSRLKRGRRNRRKKIDNTIILLQKPKYRDMNPRERRYHSANRTSEATHNAAVDTIKYENYKEDVQRKNGLYPNPIVEEYSYVNTK